MKGKRVKNLAQEYYDRGHSLVKQGQYEEAEASFTKAIKLAPNFSKAYDGLGLSYAFRKRFEEAITHYNRAIELDPTNVESFVRRGASYSRLQRHKEALADFDRAIEIDPTHENARWNKVTVLAQMGDQGPAKSSFGSEVREAAATSKDPLMAMTAKAPLMQVGFAQMEFMQASSLNDMRKASSKFPFMIEPEFEQIVIHKVVGSKPQFKRQLEWLRQIAKEQR